MFKDKDILFIVHNYNSFQKDLIEETAKYYRKVYVLVRYKPISKYIKRIPLKWLKKYDDSNVIDLSNIPQNIEVIRTPVWYIPLGFFNKFLGNLHYKSVERIIKKYKLEFDIVHSHFIWSSGYVGMKIKEKYGVPFVVTGHGFDVYSLPFKTKSWTNKTSADAVITVSENNKRHLLRLGIDEKKIEIISNGFNPRLFSPIEKEIARKELNIPKDKKVLLTVGNLEQVKGHQYLIEAVKLLKEKYPNIFCYIIGGGSLQRTLQNRINLYGLEKNIHLTGPLLHEEINTWINACDVFVLPSLAESFGIVQLEAFACGKAVVATKNFGSREILTSGDYGILCEIANSEDLADKIDIALRKKWDTKKLMDYAKNFTWEQAAQDIVNIYERLLNA